MVAIGNHHHQSSSSSSKELPSSPNEFTVSAVSVDLGELLLLVLLAAAAIVDGEKHTERKGGVCVCLSERFWRES